MDTELQNFFVTFTTEGLDKVQQDIANLSDKLDEVTSGINKSGSGLNKLSGGLGGFIGKLGLATTAAAVAAAAIKNAFTVGNDALGLKNLAEYAGVSAEKLEQMGIMMKKYGGDWKTAGQDYIKINTALGELRNRGNLSESMRDVLARYAQYGLRFSPDMSADDVLANLQSVFNKLKARGDNWGIQQIQSAYGISQPTALLLMQSMDQLREAAERARGQLVLSSEETQKNAAALQEAKQALKASWDKLSADLIPLITQVLNLLQPLVELLGPIASWALKQLGGTWDAVKDVWKWVKGDSTYTETVDKLSQNSNWGIGTLAKVHQAVRNNFKGITPQDVVDSTPVIPEIIENLMATNTPLNSSTASNNTVEKVVQIEFDTPAGTATYSVNEGGQATRVGGTAPVGIMPQILTMGNR